jgi:phenylalanyl-tRNA synthetase alpha chain
LEDLSGIVARALADFAAAGDPASLENAKARYLGKSGELSVFRATLGALPVEKRKEAGAAFNAAKERLEGGDPYLAAYRGNLALDRL